MRTHISAAERCTTEFLRGFSLLLWLDPCSDQEQALLPLHASPKLCCVKEPYPSRLPALQRQADLAYAATPAAAAAGTTAFPSAGVSAAPPVGAMPASATGVGATASMGIDYSATTTTTAAAPGTYDTTGTTTRPL